VRSSDLTSAAHVERHAVSVADVLTPEVGRSALQHHMPGLISGEGLHSITDWKNCSEAGYPRRLALMRDSGIGISDEGFCGTGTGFCEGLVAAVFGSRRMIPCRSRRLRCRREAPARWSPAGPRETLAAARSQRRNETMVYTHVLNCGALWREESGGPAGSVRPCPVAAQPR